MCPGAGSFGYMHSTVFSAFFIVVYLHMFRGLLYGSYRKPRELMWLFGMRHLLVPDGRAFMGYLLPWGKCRFGAHRSSSTCFLPFLHRPRSGLVHPRRLCGG